MRVFNVRHVCTSNYAIIVVCVRGMYIYYYLLNHKNTFTNVGCFGRTTGWKLNFFHKGVRRPILSFGAFFLSPYGCFNGIKTKGEEQYFKSIHFRTTLVVPTQTFISLSARTMVKDILFLRLYYIMLLYQCSTECCNAFTHIVDKPYLIQHYWLHDAVVYMHVGWNLF